MKARADAEAKKNAEWLKRTRKLFAEELKTPLRWMYLSFASNEKGFHGAVYLKAHGLTHAMWRCHKLGFSPDGEVCGWKLPQNIENDPNALPPPEFREKLLTKEQIRKFGHGIVNLDGDSVQ